jgi:hypothetical protein
MGEVLLPTHCPTCHRELAYLGDVERFPVLRVSARAVHKNDSSGICRPEPGEEARRPPRRANVTRTADAP